MKKKITPQRIATRSHHAKPEVIIKHSPVILKSGDLMLAELKRLNGLKVSMGGDTDTIDNQIAEIEKKMLGEKS